MTDTKEQAREAVANLIELEDATLYEALAMRMQAMREQPELAGSFQPAVSYRAEVMGPMDDLRDFGRSFFKRFSREAYRLVCGDGAEDTQERQALVDAFGLGKEAVAGALVPLLIAHLGLAPAIAPVVAALIVRLAFRPALDAMCEVWSSKLPDAEGG